MKWVPSTPSNSKCLVYQVSESLCVCVCVDLHRTRLTHTDLKPENVLFVSSEFEIYYDARMVSEHVSRLTQTEEVLWASIVIF